MKAKHLFIYTENSLFSFNALFIYLFMCVRSNVENKGILMGIGSVHSIMLVTLLQFVDCKCPYLLIYLNFSECLPFLEAQLS